MVEKGRKLIAAWSSQPVFLLEINVISPHTTHMCRSRTITKRFAPLEIIPFSGYVTVFTYTYIYAHIALRYIYTYN